MKNPVITANFIFLTLSTQIAVTGDRLLGNGWESASFDGTHVISAEIFERKSLVKDKKDEMFHALKFQVVTASTEGPQLLRWSVPESEMKKKGRWTLSFYARVKEGLLDIRSSIYQTLDESGSKTVHHMSPHLLATEWKNFTSVVRLSDHVVSKKRHP